MTEFNFKVNLKEIADQLSQKAEDIAGRVTSEVRNLSVSTHAFVVNFANENLDGFKRDHFFGENGQNVRWNQIAPNIWVVEIDESVRWIEEGREATSMATEEWLLNPSSPGVKRAKDGSLYRAIPFIHKEKGKKAKGSPEIAAMVKNQLKEKGINLNKIEKDQFGKPKLGVVQKLNNRTRRERYPDGLFSEPRNKEMADKTGLKSHTGYHYLDNAVVVQREVQGKNGKTRTSRELVTYRIVSSKHKAEGRWMYPRVEPLNSIPEAMKYADSEWDKIVKELEREFNQ